MALLPEHVYTRELYLQNDSNLTIPEFLCWHNWKILLCNIKAKNAI